MHGEMNLAQMVLDAAGVIIVAIDVNETVTEINKKGCQLLGYSREEIVGANWFDRFIPEKIREEIRPLFHKMLAETLPLEYNENPIVTANGSERIVEWHNIPLRDAEGNIVGTLSSGIDITARRQLEEELTKYRDRLEEVVATRTAEFAQLNERLIQTIAEHEKAEAGLAIRAMILDNAEEPIFLLNPKGDFAYANEAACRAYGYGRDEFLAMNLRALLRPADAPVIGARLEALWGKGQLTLETIHLRKDQTPMPVKVRHSVIQTLHGRFIVSVIRDMTDELRLRLLLAQMPALVLATDSDLRVAEARGTLSNGLAFNPGQGAPVPLSRYLDENGFGREVLAAHERARETDATVGYEVENAGQHRTFCGWAARRLDASGKPCGTVGVLVERKQPS